MATPIPANRAVFTAAEIIRAVGATVADVGEMRLEGVSIDTRTITPGALFVALRGVRDGHEFLHVAAAAGAGAALVERGRRDPALPCFEVENTLSALGAIAHFHLERTRAAGSLPTIAIGGAAGKTTTKELTAALMRALFGEILATSGNLNNLIGVPMTILTIGANHRATVLECGTNRQGEIAQLAAIVRPDVALVLNVDIEHTEGLGSLEGVADEEAALYKPAHIAVVGLEETMLTSRLPKEQRTVTFGATEAADVRLLSRTVIAPGRQRITLGLAPSLAAGGVEPRLDATLDLLGATSANNAAAAVASAAAACGPLGRDQIAAMAYALAAVRPVPGRLSTTEIEGIVVIDDTYNANPRSVRAALAAARETADGIGAQLIVALGDMLELGSLSAAMHAEAVRDVFRARPVASVLVGPALAAVANRAGADASNSLILRIARDSDDAARIVRALVHPGDVLLVKGSRGIAMERVINGLA